MQYFVIKKYLKNEKFVFKFALSNKSELRNLVYILFERYWILYLMDPTWGDRMEMDGNNRG